MLCGINLINFHILALAERGQNTALRICSHLFLIVTVFAVDFHEAVKDDY